MQHYNILNYNVIKFFIILRHLECFDINGLRWLVSVAYYLTSVPLFPIMSKSVFE